MKKNVYNVSFSSILTVLIIQTFNINGDDCNKENGQKGGQTHHVLTKSRNIMQ